MSYDYGIKEISKWTGLTGVQSKHVVRELGKRGIAYDLIDWKAVGESARDYGDRYSATFNKIQEMYGIQRKPREYKRLPSRSPLPQLTGIQMEMCNIRQAKRSFKAQLVDQHKPARRTFNITNKKGVKLWMKNPNRFDIRGIDTPFKRRRRTKK